MPFEPIELTAREKEFADLRKITEAECVEASGVALRACEEEIVRSRYGPSLARQMYKLWWEATFGRRF